MPTAAVRKPATGGGYGHWWPDETSGGELAVAAFSSGTPSLPCLDDVVEVAAGRYRLGEPGEEREVDVGAVLVGRYPVTERAAGGVRRGHRPTASPLTSPGGSSDPQLADHPATGLTFAEAEAFCAWATAELARPVRLPTGARVGGGGPRPRFSAVAVGPHVRSRTLRLRRERRRLDRSGRVTPHGREPYPRRAARRERVGVGRRPARPGLARGARRFVPRPRVGFAGEPVALRRPDAGHAHHRLSHRHRPRPQHPEEGRRACRCPTGRGHDRRRPSATCTTHAAPSAASASSTWD